jgi:signal transduction histidine kinase
MLSNSLEHAINDPQTGADYIQIRTTTADDGILLEVSDDGPGIPQGELDVLTKHGETALEHGSGVGLWLIDRITQYSDATIDFDTESGTTIQVCLQSTGASSSM